MPLACLSDVRDPSLLDEIFHLHCSYQHEIPNIAENYVRSLLCKPPRKFVQRPNRRSVLSNGLTVTELILQRCDRDRFVSFYEICQGLTSHKERKHVSETLFKMTDRGRLVRTGSRKAYLFRLNVD